MNTRAIQLTRHAAQADTAGRTGRHGTLPEAARQAGSAEAAKRLHRNAANSAAERHGTITLAAHCASLLNTLTYLYKHL